MLPEAIELFGAEHEEEARFIMHNAVRQEEDHEESGHGGFPWVFFAVLVTFYALFFLERVLIPKVAAHSEAKNGGKKKANGVPADGALSDTDRSEITEMQVPEQFLEVVSEESEPCAICDEAAAAGFRSALFAKGLVEILGLSAHSLFESLALGLADDFSTVLHVFIATVSHRWATSTAVAFKMCNGLRYGPFLVLLGLFSAMVPLGIGVGAGLEGLGERVRGVLFAISAGSFLYVGAFDGVAEEFAVKGGVGRKFAAMIGGAGVIVGITGILVATGVHG